MSDKGKVFRVGDKVRVIDGLFKGFRGTVTDDSENGVLVELVVYGRITPPVPITRDDLRTDYAENPGN